MNIFRGITQAAHRNHWEVTKKKNQHQRYRIFLVDDSIVCSLRFNWVMYTLAHTCSPWKANYTSRQSFVISKQVIRALLRNNALCNTSPCITLPPPVSLEQFKKKKRRKILMFDYDTLFSTASISILIEFNKPKKHLTASDRKPWWWWCIPSIVRYKSWDSMSCTCEVASRAVAENKRKERVSAIDSSLDDNKKSKRERERVGWAWRE